MRSVLERFQPERFPTEACWTFLQKFDESRQSLRVISSHWEGLSEAIIDVRLARSANEDETFASEDRLRFRLRRGLSFLRVSHDHSKSAEHLIIRRGLPKFFDYPIWFNASKDSIENAVRTRFTHQLRMLSELPREASASVVVHVLDKLNGENAQISPGPNGLWVCASKNVSICVDDRGTQLKLLFRPYKGVRRFETAIRVAVAWLTLLSGLPPSSVEALRAALEGFTLVGELFSDAATPRRIIEPTTELQNSLRAPSLKPETLIGLSDKEYTINRGSIVFFAVVPHDEKSSLEGPIVAFRDLHEKLRALRIPVLEPHVSSTFSASKSFQIPVPASVNLVREHLSACEKAVFVERGTEGVVVYLGLEFHSRSAEAPVMCGRNFFLFNVFKMKSFEYRLKRRIRESLKTLVSRLDNLDTRLHLSSSHEIENAFNREIAAIADPYVEYLEDESIQKQTLPEAKRLNAALITFIDYVSKHACGDTSIGLSTRLKRCLDDDFLNISRVALQDDRQCWDKYISSQLHMTVVANPVPRSRSLSLHLLTHQNQFSDVEFLKLTQMAGVQKAKDALVNAAGTYLIPSWGSKTKALKHHSRELNDRAWRVTVNRNPINMRKVLQRLHPTDNFRWTQGNPDPLKLERVVLVYYATEPENPIGSPVINADPDMRSPKSQNSTVSLESDITELLCEESDFLMLPARKKRALDCDRERSNSHRHLAKWAESVVEEFPSKSASEDDTQSSFEQFTCPSGCCLCLRVLPQVVEVNELIKVLAVTDQEVATMRLPSRNVDFPDTCAVPVPVEESWSVSSPSVSGGPGSELPAPESNKFTALPQASVIWLLASGIPGCGKSTLLNGVRDAFMRRDQVIDEVIVGTPELTLRRLPFDLWSKSAFGVDSHGFLMLKGCNNSGEKIALLSVSSDATIAAVSRTRRADLNVNETMYRSFSKQARGLIESRLETYIELMLQEGASQIFVLYDKAQMPEHIQSQLQRIDQIQRRVGKVSRVPHRFTSILLTMASDVKGPFSNDPEASQVPVATTHPSQRDSVRSDNLVKHGSDRFWPPASPLMEEWCPWTYDTLAECCIRMLLREGHETLIEASPQAINIFLSFVSRFCQQRSWLLESHYSSQDEISSIGVLTSNKFPVAVQKLSPALSGILAFAANGPSHGHSECEHSVLLRRKVGELIRSTLSANFRPFRDNPQNVEVYRSMIRILEESRVHSRKDRQVNEDVIRTRIQVTCEEILSTLEAQMSRENTSFTCLTGFSPVSAREAFKARLKVQGCPLYLGIHITYVDRTRWNGSLIGCLQRLQVACARCVKATWPDQRNGHHFSQAILKAQLFPISQPHVTIQYFGPLSRFRMESLSVCDRLSSCIGSFYQFRMTHLIFCLEGFVCAALDLQQKIGIEAGRVPFVFESPSTILYPHLTMSCDRRRFRPVQSSELIQAVDDQLNAEGWSSEISHLESSEDQAVRRMMPQEVGIHPRSTPFVTQLKVDHADQNLVEWAVYLPAPGGKFKNIIVLRVVFLSPHQ